MLNFGRLGCRLSGCRFLARARSQYLFHADVFRGRLAREFRPFGANVRSAFDRRFHGRSLGLLRFSNASGQLSSLLVIQQLRSLDD